MPAGVWATLLRLVTHRRIFPVTSTLDETFAFIEAVCAEPGYLTLAPGARHIALLRELCDDTAANGDLVPDAVLAAMAVEHGCVIVTRPTLRQVQNRGAPAALNAPLAIVTGSAVQGR